MREISKAMRPLSDDELADYHVNERINDRGVLVDVALAKAAMRYSQAELLEVEDIVSDVTNGEITSVRSPHMREWVLERVGPEAKKLMIVHKKRIIALFDNADPSMATFRYAGCVMQIERDPEVLLAGEYDIVRDEITGGKWSREAHRISTAPRLFPKGVMAAFTDSFRFDKYDDAG
jgi:hypothetical protein